MTGLRNFDQAKFAKPHVVDFPGYLRPVDVMHPLSAPNATDLIGLICDQARTSRS
jgi:hypothetical protein